MNKLREWWLTVTIVAALLGAGATAMATWGGKANAEEQHQLRRDVDRHETALKFVVDSVDRFARNQDYQLVQHALEQQRLLEQAQKGK